MNPVPAQRDESWFAIVLKVVLRLVPTRVKAAIAATAINAAISAYSIAVTPYFSLMRFRKNRNPAILLFGARDEIAGRTLTDC